MTPRTIVRNLMTKEQRRYNLSPEEAVVVAYERAENATSGERKVVNAERPPPEATPRETDQLAQSDESGE